MSGPKSSSYNVVSAEERRRREDMQRKRACDNMLSELGQLNEMILKGGKVHVDSSTIDDHEGLKRREAELVRAVQRAKAALQKQRQSEQKCRFLEEQINRVRADLSNPEEFALKKPAISSQSDLRAWEKELVATLNDAEYRSARDAVALSNKASKKLDLTGVELSKKEHFRIEEIQVARRMDKLSKVAASIADIEDESTRETFVLESASLLDRERDDEFDEAVIDINTRIRAIKQIEQRKADALKECSKISHLSSDEAKAVCALAEKVRSAEDLFAVRERVASLLDEEDRELDERYVRKAIRETLLELGYDYGEGFVQTDYGPVAYAEKNTEHDYALRVQVSSTGQRIFTRVVSLADTTPGQDEAAEERLCEDYHSMIQGLRDKGVETTLEREAQPGEYPLDKLGMEQREKLARARRRRRTAVASRRGNA